MKRFLTWTAIVSGTVVGGTLAFQAVGSMRRRLKQSVGRAERVAAHTRAALQETEQALHDVQGAL